MRLRFFLVLLAVAVLTAGCAGTRPSEPGTPGPDGPPPSPGSGAAAQGDVAVDGASILGTWYAVEVAGNAEATRDLEDGTMEQVLIVSSNGRAILTGVDRREGGDPVAFAGRVTGSRVTFAGMEGAGTLLMSGRRLVLRDPAGRSTVFVRGGG